MMKLAIFALLVAVAAASVPLVSRQRAVIVHQPHHPVHHYGYGLGHGYGIGHGYGLGYGHGHGVSARYFDKVIQPGYGIYSPVEVPHGGHYPYGVGYGLLGLGYGRGYYL